MGTIYRNGQYYGGSSGGATAELDRHEIGYGNDESNIVGSGLFTKKNANIVEDLCEEQQSNSLEFIIDSTTDGDMPAGTITISNGTLETDYDSTQYVKDYEGHGYIGPVLYQVTSGQNYGIKFSFETFNKVLADKDYYLSFVGYEDYANLSFHKTVESVTESGATVYNVTCTANTKDAFEGQIVFPPTTGQDLAIYNGNADQDGGKFFLKNKGILCIGGNNLTALDGNTRFTMHDRAEMDLTGGVNRPNAGPKVYMHGEAQVNFDDGRYWVGPEYRPYYTFVSETITYDEPKDENYSFSYVSHNPSYTYYDGQKWITLSDLNGSSWNSWTNTINPQVTKFCLTPSYRCGVEDMEYYSVEEKTRSVYDDNQKKSVTKYYYIVKRKFVVNSGIQPSINRVRLNENKDPLIKITDGPQVFMNGFPTVQLEDKSKIRMSSDGMITIDQGSHLHMNGQISEGTQWYDRYEMKWKPASQMASEIGSLSENQFGNELNIEGVNLIRFHGTEFTNEVNIEGCKINIGVKNTSGGAPQILIKENVDIDIGGVEQIRCEGVPKYRGGEACKAAVIKICDRSEVQLHGYSLLDLKDAATLRLKNNTVVEMGDNSTIETTGNSRIALQDIRKTGGYGSPVIHGNPNQFMFGAFGISCDDSTSALQSFDDGGSDSITYRLTPWEEGETAIAEIRKEQYYRNITATTEEDINKLNTIFSKYASKVDEDKQYYSYIKTTNMYYITNEEYEAFMTWAKNKYGTGNYNYNRCNVIFTQRYVLKPEKRQDFYELTKELETIYTSYSTWSGWYPLIIANGENIEDYFDILWQKYDYYYQNYGYYYDGYYYYNKPTPNKTFEYISSSSSYISAFTQIFKNHPEYLDCISYIEVDSKIYPYTVIDMDKFNELKNNFDKYTNNKLFLNTYDSEGNVISKRLSSKTVTESTNYCSKELAKYKGYMFCVQGDSRVIIGSSNAGQYADSEWTASRGKLYIDIKPTKPEDNMNILMSDSIFVQATGNSHIESHDNSTVVMRGNLPIVNGKKKKPWADGVVNWTRPVQSKGDSPIVGLYDAPTVLIRGTWDTEDDDATNPKPEDWVEHPEKQEGSPVVEIIENSELRLYGSSSIKMDDEGITFGNTTGTASFTIEELNNLKNGSGGGSGGDNPPYELPIASETELGGVKIGEGINIAEDGTISVEIPESSEPYELPAATNTTLGGVKVGKGLSINDNGVLSANAQELTPATEETLGGVKVGKGLSVDKEGILSVNGNATIGLEESDGIEINEIESSDLTGLPEGYSKISYIDNKAKSWILLDYIPNENTRVEIDFSINTDMENKDAALFGSRNGSSSGSRQFVFWADATSERGKYFAFVYGGNTWGEVSQSNTYFPSPSQPVAYEQRVHADVSKNGVYIDNEKIQDINVKGTPSPYKMAVFACATNNTGSTAYSPGDYKVYSMKIYEGEELKLDLVPALNSKKQAGLYDKINNDMYTSMTTTDFVYNENSIIENTKKYSIGIKYDSNTLAINENNELTVISNSDDEPYELPTASSETLGGVKVPESAGLQVNENGELDLKIKIVPCTQEQYDALEVKDPNTLYLIGD